MKIVDILTSTDKTQKYTYLTKDDYYIESCAVFFEGKESPLNICVSSQVGCRYSCSFCVTGNKKFLRSLSSDEIIAQVDMMMEKNAELRNYSFEITYMGTGEPLDNLEHVVGSMKYFSEMYPKLSRINISTTLPSLSIDLYELQKIQKKVHIQYSLHFTNDIKRKSYFRNNDLPNIADSLNFLAHFSKSISDRLCLNYILFRGINDSTDDAEQLATLAKYHNCYIKISKYSEISLSELASTREEDLLKFAQKLKKSNVDFKIFQSKGEDIHASCGHFLHDIVF